LADDEPEAMETLAGICIRLLLALRPIELADVVAPVNVTVQEEDPPELKVDGVQDNEERLAGSEEEPELAATRLSANVLPEPEVLAVRVAVASLETFATFAVKLALVLPAPMLTLPGIVTLELLLDRDTEEVADGAGLTETVQVAEPGAFTLPGEQENPERAVWVCTPEEMAPPLPDAGIEEPSPLAANAFVT
jgi:hypothetical protein